MWNIKQALRATVTPNVVHEDHVLFVIFGHELDDANDEPQSVTLGRASQPRRRGWEHLPQRRTIIVCINESVNSFD
jgi:hypothetical protein